MDLVDSAVAGYNATIFAYGATGSGKTHTMSGTPEFPGITPRTIEYIFRKVNEAAADDTETMFMITMGFVELYNNTFRDLLEGRMTKRGRKRQHKGAQYSADSQSSTSTMASTSSSSSSSLSSSTASTGKYRRARVDIRESASGGVYLTGSESLRMPVKSAEEAMMLVQYGLNARAVGRTNLNEHSSRSHSILTINIQRASSVDGFTSSVCLGKIHLVDLAGSERLGMSGAVGSQLKETQNINLSLSSLGNVLSALSKFHSDSRTGEASSSRRKPVVPYRDSKLTYLLRDSLGGNSKTVMITNIRSPAAFYQQSKISLMYASRAKNISNSTRVNTDAVGASSMQQLSSQVEILRAKLMERTAEFQRLRGLQRSSHESKDLKEKLASMAKQNQRERDQLESYLTDVIMNREGKLEKQRKAYEELQESVSEHRDIVAAQRQEITSLRSAVEEGEGEANQLRLALQHAQSDVQRVRNQRDAAGRRLAQESERIRAIVEEWDKQKTELKTRIHELEKERSDAADSSSSSGSQEAQRPSPSTRKA